MPHTQQPRSPRGVWRMHALSAAGYPIVWVVTADNHRILERHILPGEDREKVESWLWHWLDEQDPLVVQLVG